jgi:hypothetical protein
MSDEELNAAAAKAMGWTQAELSGVTRWWLAAGKANYPVEGWSPATKIEHAWIVQEAAVAKDRILYGMELRRRSDDQTSFWHATAPPRARTEAAVAVLAPNPATAEGAK